MRLNWFKSVLDAHLKTRSHKNTHILRNHSTDGVAKHKNNAYFLNIRKILGCVRTLITFLIRSFSGGMYTKSPDTHTKYKLARSDRLTVMYTWNASVQRAPVLLRATTVSDANLGPATGPCNWDYNCVYTTTLTRTRQNGALYAHCDLVISEFILCNIAQYLNSSATYHQIATHFGASDLRTFHTSFVHRPWNVEYVTISHALRLHYKPRG